MKFLRKYNESNIIKGWCNDSNFESLNLLELLKEFRRCDEEWLEGNLEEYPNCLLHYYYIIKPNFKIIIIGKKPSNLGWQIYPNVYLEYTKEDKSEVLLYLNNLFIPNMNKYLYKTYNRNKYTDFALSLGMKQMQYFDTLEKFPTKKELIMLLVDISDDYECTNIKFGYFNKGKEDDITYLNDNSYNKIGYVITYDLNGNIDIENIEEKIEHLRGRLDFYGKFNITFTIDNLSTRHFGKKEMYITITE